MDVNNENMTYQVDWICPACVTNTNSQGIPFSGSRAVALHIAGKILSYDDKYQHRNWVTDRLGDSIHDYFDYTINTLAKELEPYVLKDYETRSQNEEEKIKRIVMQQEASEEPSVLAYKYILKLERRSHRFIRQILENEYGKDESEWWAKGVPAQIRIECAKRREDDPLREELYSYTDLIDLKTIFDKNWRVFEPQFKLVGESFNTKKELLDAIAHSNEIRKRVMHPTRMVVDNDEIVFLEQFCSIIEEVVNKQSMKLPNWEDVLTKIQETKKNKTHSMIDSYRWFYEEGLGRLITSKNPILSNNHDLELVFSGIEFYESDNTPELCKETSSTYASPLYVRTELWIKPTGEIKEQEVFLADIPMMTEDGTFIINGVEKTLTIESIASRVLNRSLLDSGLDTLKAKAIIRMNRISVTHVVPSRLIDSGSFVEAVGEFFSSSPRLVP